MDEPDEDLQDQGEEEKGRLNRPYWWRRYQLPTEIVDHHAFVPVEKSGKVPIRVLLNDGIRAGDITATQKAVNAGADVKHVNIDGRAPVHEAVLNDQASIVQTLWDNGAEVDVKMPYTKDTALHLAARQNAAASVRSLVRVEASTDLLNKDGETALHVAARNGFYEAARELLAGGADTSIRNHDGHTAKELAELNDFPELAAYLLNFD